MKSRDSNYRDVIIIGAGQYGLALARCLKGCLQSSLILEASGSLGLQWKFQYDSLALFTPRGYSSLPGLPLDNDQGGYATKDEFAEYLRRYAKAFAIPIVFNARVLSLTKIADQFISVTTSGTYYSRNVVIATGYRQPTVPEFSVRLSSRVFQIHSSNYINIAQIPKGKVLIVGKGNSAAQIACELSTTHRVVMSFEKEPRMISPKIFGKSYYWWQKIFGLHNIPARSFLGRLLSKRTDYVIGKGVREAIRRGRILKRSRAIDACVDGVIFANGSCEKFDAVIWATGYTKDISWINIDGVFDKEGQPIQQDGLCKVPGLYFAGLHSQFTHTSSNISGAARTASVLAKRLCVGVGE